jgi:uncharacterized protein
MRSFCAWAVCGIAHGLTRALGADLLAGSGAAPPPAGNVFSSFFAETVPMTDPARNKETLRRAYQLWHETKGGSREHWTKLVADDITFGSLAEGMAPATFTARIRGKDRLSGYFDGLLSGWEMVYYTVHHFVAEGDRVVAICSTSWRNRATGKICDTPKVDVWRFRDDLAIEFYEYYDTAKLLAAAS